MRKETGIALFLGILAAPQGAAVVLDLADIDLPKGIVIEEYAHVPNARSLALGDDGVVYVGNRTGDSVYAVVPSGDANPQVLKIISGLEMPNGIAYYNGDLFVAEVKRILRYRDVGNLSLIHI